MSERERAKKLIDSIPESRLMFVISYLQGAAIPDEVPNSETIESMKELDSGGGTAFSGATDELFAELLEE